MDKQEIFSMLRRNGHEGRPAIRLISDFLAISWEEAAKIYNEEYLPQKEDKAQNKPYKDKCKTGVGYKRFVTYKGETHCLTEWAEIMGISYPVLMNRLNSYLWTFERAVTTPARSRGKYKA